MSQHTATALLNRQTSVGGELADSEYAISIQSGYVLVEDPPDYDVVWIEQQPKLKAISAVCDEAGFRKVLMLGAKASVKLSALEIYLLGEEVARLRLMVAVVNVHDASKQNVAFLENVSANRGGRIQFFDNEPDAKDWLGV